MRLLLSKKEGEFLVGILEDYRTMCPLPMLDLLIDRIHLCLQLQHNESMSKS